MERSGVQAGGVENDKTTLINVGYRGLIRLLCHSVMKYMWVANRDVKLTDSNEAHVTVGCFSANKSKEAPRQTGSPLHGYISLLRALLMS